jgi:hypothetical protein
VVIFLLLRMTPLTQLPLPDLQSFRQALSVLQAEVDELDRLKVAHYTQILDHEEQVWDVVSGKICLVVRSSLDVFDRVTSKA